MLTAFVFLVFSVTCTAVDAKAANIMAVASENVTSREVCLEGSFNAWDDLSMSSIDGTNYITNLTLTSGVYQFRILEDGITFGHTGTIIDSTVEVSTSGWTLSSSINAKCTLLATGGEYSFLYNAETHKLQIIKDGIIVPDIDSDTLNIKIGGAKVSAKIGDTLRYDVYMSADKIFEDIQAIVTYNEEKLKLITVSTDDEVQAKLNCPNLEEVTYNWRYDGIIAANASDVDGYDFTEEKQLFSFDFEVVDGGLSCIELVMQEMTVLGAEHSYFSYSTKVSDGVKLKIDVEVVQNSILPTDPEETTAAETDPSETLPQQTTATETTVLTDPVETTTASSTEVTEEADPTEQTTAVVTEASTSSYPAENSSVSTTATTAVVTDASSSAETTCKETESTTPSETIATTEPASEFETGDVNRDGKVNIRDATLVQKYLAKMVELDDEQKFLADFKIDGKINIKDATAIQKKIANII